MDEKRLKDVGDCIGAVLNDNLGLYYETYTGNGTSADWTNFLFDIEEYTKNRLGRKDHFHERVNVSRPS